MTDAGGTTLISKQAIAPVVLGLVVVASVVVAAVIGKPVWAAAVGSGLALVYWGLEALAWRRARTRRDLALGVAVGGMALRLAVVLGTLVLVGVLARPAFATAALRVPRRLHRVSAALRPLTFAPAPARPGQAGAAMKKGMKWAVAGRRASPRWSACSSSRAASRRPSTSPASSTCEPILKLPVRRASRPLRQQGRHLPLARDRRHRRLRHRHRAQPQARAGPLPGRRWRGSTRWRATASPARS